MTKLNNSIKVNSLKGDQVFEENGSTFEGKLN